MAPRHLARLTDALERSTQKPVRAIVNLPPRHSKTETLLHFIAWRLKRRPWETIAYVTYVDQIANEKSVLARQYAERAGVQLRPDANRLDRWMTEENGGAIFRSIGGAITALGADVLIVDDPHSGRIEAESAVHRDRVWSWYEGTATDRVERGGSIIICQTRWHPDDLTGRVLERHTEEAWEVVSLPALGRDVDGVRIPDDDGEPLWPDRWDREALLKKKFGGEGGEYEWQSKYQQRPQKRGGTVFRDVRWYDPARVPGGMRISIGIDLAYSGKTHSHWSVVVVLGELGDTIYVLYVQREQMEVPQFAEIVLGQCAMYPGVPVRWHTSTTEAGVAQLLKQLGIPVKNELAKADKFTRAQPIAAKWNMGRVVVPGGFAEDGSPVELPSWVSPFVNEVQRFTGLGDVADDQVDALGSAYSPWARASTGRIDSGDESYGFG